MGRLKRLPRRYNADNHNEALIVWGDTDGYVNVIFWRSAQTVLFERPPNLPQEKEGMISLSENSSFIPYTFLNFLSRIHNSCLV